MIGEVIGHFKIVARLGRGGMGEVWLASQQSIGTVVAIKMLREDISEDEAQVQRFFNEARAVSQIHHAGIVRIFDVGRHGGRAYLVMEYLDGESLGSRLRRVGRLPAGALAEIARQTASVLDAVRAAAITHRDLKPDNIFLVPDHELASRERVKVLDFGIAKLAGTTSPGTHGTMGTPLYMAPEQWGDTSNVDWRTDAYSLGCVAFEMACGRPPFSAKTFAEACAKHLGEIPPTARSLVPGLPAALDALLVRLLAKQPAERAGSMDEIQQAFAAIAAADPVEPPALAPTMASGDVARDTPTVETAASTVDSTLGKGEQVAPPPSRRGWWIVAALGLAGIGGGALLAISRNRSEVVSASRDATIVAMTADAAVVPDAAVDAAVVHPDAAAPRPDAAPRPARAQHTFPHDRSLAVEDMPDEPDRDMTNTITDEIVDYVRAHCGPWPSSAPVQVSFEIIWGKTDNVQPLGPDAHAEICIANAFRAAQYPMAKKSYGMSINLAR